MIWVLYIIVDVDETCYLHCYTVSPVWRRVLSMLILGTCTVTQFPCVEVHPKYVNTSASYGEKCGCMSTRSASKHADAVFEAWLLYGGGFCAGE